MKLPVTLYIYKRENPLYKIIDGDEKFDYDVANIDMGNASSWGVRVAEIATELTFDDLSHADYVQAQVNDLKAQAKQIQADAQAKVTAIEGKINSLLAIETKESGDE